ncbi:hypothetical protein P280DRAFT_476029 [Massarina eburnea CBS 473.64]|uniref:Uncharacterized protein n=1 Tax=Massarina eburnea CBS 473.64 TaxID=1395130 RepID=A0A6A6SGC3_9PLEO|nr:hypothetical protein P280DRAFT_476029 [Massarina eburnea CBS 473.64]
MSISQAPWSEQGPPKMAAPHEQHVGSVLEDINPQLFPIPSNHATPAVVREYLFNILARGTWNLTTEYMAEIASTLDVWRGDGEELRQMYDDFQLHRICPITTTVSADRLDSPRAISSATRLTIAMCVAREMERYFVWKSRNVTEVEDAEGLKRMDTCASSRTLVPNQERLEGCGDEDYVFAPMEGVKDSEPPQELVRGTTNEAPKHTHLNVPDIVEPKEYPSLTLTRALVLKALRDDYDTFDDNTSSIYSPYEPSTPIETAIQNQLRPNNVISNTIPPTDFLVPHRRHSSMSIKASPWTTSTGLGRSASQTVRKGKNRTEIPESVPQIPARSPLRLVSKSMPDVSTVGSLTPSESKPSTTIIETSGSIRNLPNEPEEKLDKLNIDTKRRGMVKDVEDWLARTKTGKVGGNGAHSTNDIPQEPGTPFGEKSEGKMSAMNVTDGQDTHTVSESNNQEGKSLLPPNSSSKELVMHSIFHPNAASRIKRAISVKAPRPTQIAEDYTVSQDMREDTASAGSKKKRVFAKIKKVSKRLSRGSTFRR